MAFLNLPQKTAPQPSFGSFAMPQGLPEQITSIFDLLRRPQNAQFDVTQATGTKPKNYRPAQIGMSGVPMASIFGLPGVAQPPQNIFTVTPATGTKPKNYRPAQIQMNAPTIAGPEAMQQMLALMSAARPVSPFAPFGQG